MFSFLKSLFSKQINLVTDKKEKLPEWEKAIFYSELKGKDHKQLHKIAFEQIAETAVFVGNDYELLLTLLWNNWEKPINMRLLLKQLSETVEEFEWEWFNEWERVFLEKKQFPHTWNKYLKKTRKEIKLALFYHSVHCRFSALRRYEDHYAMLEECTWSEVKYQARLSILDDDIVEKEIVEPMKIIEDNVILSLPPYIPAGRTSIMYDRVRVE